MRARVSGLNELQRALREIEDPAGKAKVVDAMREIAELVVVGAQQKIPTRSGRAAASLRVEIGNGGAYIVAGLGADVKYYGWLEFGSRTPRSGNPRRVGPWSGSGTGPKEGRFIYPTLSEDKAAIVEIVAEAVGQIAREAGF